MNKKAVKYVLGGIILLIVTIVIVRFTYTDNEKLGDGTYEIEDNEEYPDAKIVVKDGNLQFFNIDLNAIYQEKQIKEYKSLIEKYPDLAFSDEELKKYSDLNAWFVKQPYEIDYDRQCFGKEGTFSYGYALYPGTMSFGFGLEYDFWHKTIRVQHFVKEITFSK